MPTMNASASPQKSIVELLAKLPPSMRKQELDRLPTEDLSALFYSWKTWARPEQLAPEGVWYIWLILAGRGWGKTRTGAEWIKTRVRHGYRRIALVGATPKDVRDVMIEGESGLLSIYPQAESPKYEPAKGRVVWKNGARAQIYSAHKKPEESGLRGPQFDTGWGDEPAKWKYPGNYEQLMFGMRLGTDPRVALTGTPRTIPLIRNLVRREQAGDTGVAVTIGTTYENMANLSDVFINEVIKPYEGTRLGRQELLAQLLDDVEGALWNRAMLEQMFLGSLPEDGFERIVVSVDPAVTANEESCETGIIVAGRSNSGVGVCLEDASMKDHPAVWAAEVVRCYHEYHADCIVVEVNNGGDLVEHTIRSLPGCSGLPIRQVRASRGKYTRAEPVALLSEKGRVKMLGAFPILEDQLVTWVPGEKSPDRLDAFVWAFWELLVQGTVFDISGGGERAPVAVGHNGGGQAVDEAILADVKRYGFWTPGN